MKKKPNKKKIQTNNPFCNTMCLAEESQGEYGIRVNGKNNFQTQDSENMN